MDNGTKGTTPWEGIGRDHADHRVPDEGTQGTTEGRTPVDELIIQLLNGTASRFEEERLKQWRDSTPENEEYFQEMTQVWNLTAPEAVVPASGPPTVEELLATELIPFDLVDGSIGARATGTRSPWIRWGLLAASVAAVGLGIQVLGPGGPTPFAIHEAAQDENLPITLRDGSFVRLAQGSTLREWEAEGRREVSLDGRAFFAVTRDESRPFVVRAGAGEVRVLGTRFQVNTEGNQIEAVVLEGLVRVSNDLGSVEVPAGSRAQMPAREAPVAMEVNDVFAFLNWPEGTLVFHSTPLAQVVDEVSRYYGRTLSVDGSDLSQRRVTAWFQGEPFDAVAESLCIVTETVCRTAGESVTMGTGGSGVVR